MQNLILTKVDYCNAILFGANKCHLSKLQKLINSSVRFIFNLKGHDYRQSITPYLKKVHFLPVKYRVDFKIALHVFKYFQCMTPDYLRDIIKPKVSVSSLRCYDDCFLLEEPFTKLAYKQKGFSFSAPHVWNKLPYDIRCITNVDQFKTELKTFYYEQAFC